jgi:serine phosphatase RsbU (regulator of sigma subunit)
MLFYTDGLVEWRDRGVDAGMRALLEFVTDLDDLSPQSPCDTILEWRLEISRRDDDVCIVAVRAL